MVRRDVALMLVVQIEPPDVQRVLAQGKGNLVNNRLHGQHALRTTKATKRCVGYRIGATTQSINLHCRQVIGIVGMEHGAINNRIR